MKRRDFIKMTLATSSSIFVPHFSLATTLDISNINFSSTIYNNNHAQTIIIFLYGGASQLGGNITNLTEIEISSDKKYNDYFRNITPTINGCWKEAGGEEMETLISNGDMTLFRCCYSQVREDNNNKSHGSCVNQNQKGSFTTDDAGILSNIASVLLDKSMIDTNTLMPFVTMEGESHFYDKGNLLLPSYVEPMGMNEDFDNPYKRYLRNWTYYTDTERKNPNYYKNDTNGGFNPALDIQMDKVAQNHNKAGKIKKFFTKREDLSNFMTNVLTTVVPDLGVNNYPNNTFSNKLKAAIKLLDKNPDTKIITLGTNGLGGWDDHDNANSYVRRKSSLFKSLKSAMAHLKILNKDGQINIMVYGDFGRNVNLNSAYGWDHGNLQNFYVLGGQNYFNHKGIVGETVLDVTGEINRLWLKPKPSTYWFEPLSIAATLYKIYGIENPEELTGGYKEITPLFT